MPYSADDIVVLSTVEGIRRRPAIYLGALDHGGLLRMIEGAMCLGLDALADGAATRVLVAVDDDGEISIDDDGRGIPPVRVRPSGPTLVESLLTVLAACRAARARQDVADRLCAGVGMVVVNALSESCALETHVDGGAWRIAYARGELVTPLHRVGDTARSGTRLRFRPDAALFGEVRVDRAALAERLAALGREFPCGPVTLLAPSPPPERG